MVDVGTVTVGVEVSGHGLGERLAEEIRRAVEPAIRQVNAQLHGMNREIHDLDTSKFQELGASAREVSEKIREIDRDLKRTNESIKALDTRKFSALRDSAAKAAVAIALTGTSATNAGREIDRSIEKSIQMYDRLGRAAERAAARQITAAQVAATVNTDYDKLVNAAERKYEMERARSRPPPGRGGGYRGYRGRGDGYQGYGRLAANTISNAPTGMNLVALGVGALPTLATGTVQVVAGLEQLSGIALAVPGIMASMGASIGTAALGFHGMGDAIKHTIEAMQTGDWKKANKDLEDMAPNAVSLVKALAGLAPEFEGLKKNVQQNMFEGMDKAATDMVHKTLPTVKTGLDEISKAWNSTLKALTGAVGADSTQGFLSRIFGDTAKAQAISSRGIAPFVHAMGTLSAAGADTLPRLAEAIDHVIGRFDRFIDRSDKSGDLNKWINDAETGFTKVGNATLNIGKAIHDITSAAGGGGGFLQWLENSTAKLHDFLSSPRGQDDLKKFFADGKHIMSEWSPILKDLATKIIPDVVNACMKWSEVVLPILHQITAGFSSMPQLVKSIVEGFLAFKTVTSIFGWLTGKSGMGGVAEAAEAAAGKVGKLESALGRLKGAAGVLGAGALLQGLDNPEVKTKPGELTPANQLGKRPGLSTAMTIGGATALGWRLGGLPGATIGLGAGMAIEGIRERQLSDHQIDAFRNAVNNAGPTLGHSVGVMDRTNQQWGLYNQFYGKNLQDPRTFLSAAGQPGSFGYDQTLSDLKSGKYSQFGVNSGNAEQTLKQMISDAREMGASLDKLKNDITTLPNGQLQITDPTPEVLQRIEALGLKVTGLEGHPGTVVIDTSQIDVAKGKIDAVLNAVLQMQQGVQNIPNLPVVPSPGQQFGPGFPGFSPPGTPGYRGPGSAVGGITPGYTPGRDTMLWPLSGGEGILIPEVMAQPGARQWLYGVNSMFRGGLPRSNYGLAGGGVAGFNGGGVNDGLGTPTGSDAVVTLLTQIRDLLSGRLTGPIQTTGHSTEKLAGSFAGGGMSRYPRTGAGGYPGMPSGEIPTGRTGPFGTPITQTAGSMAYNIAAAELRAFGMNPDYIIGLDPAQYGAGMVGGMGGRGGGAASLIGPLSDFARTRNYTSSLSNMGIDPNAAVIKAIMQAEGRRKGALSSDEVSGLIAEVLGPGFTGQMTNVNEPLIAALQRLRNKMPMGVVPGMAPSGLGGATGVMPGAAPSGLGGPVGSKAGLQPAASNLWDVIAANFPQIREIGGVRSDAKPYHPSGRALDLMIPGGDTSGGQNPQGKELGDQIYQFLMANAASLGVDTSGTLWQTMTGGNHFNHIHAQLLQNAGFAAGGAGVMPAGFGAVGSGGAGGATPVYVTNWPGGAVGAAPAGAAGTPAGGPDGAVPTGAFGTPVPPGPTGALQAAQSIGGPVLNSLLHTGGEVINKVGGDILNAAASGTSGVRGILQPSVSAAAPASFSSLIRQHNPLAGAALAGVPVPDLSVAGASMPLSSFATPPQAYNALGQLFSNTSPIGQRTMTDLSGSINAMKAEVVMATHEVQQQLTSNVLVPMLSTGVTTGMDNLSNALLTNWGGAMGGAMAPPIAAAISNATVAAATTFATGAPIIAADGSPSNVAAGNSSQAITAAPAAAAAGFLTSVAGAANVFDSGGLWTSGSPGYNLSGKTERVLSPVDTQLFDAGRLGGWSSPFRPHWIGGAAGAGTTGQSATQPGIGNPNLAVGAQFLGVSQVPILAEIVNIIVNILLTVIGINVQVASTLNNVSTNFQQFRGEFQKFNALGQLFADTSGITDRSRTSTSQVAQERLQILEQVISGLIQYIINNVIVPLIKAIANAAIQAGASAAGTAVSAGISGASAAGGVSSGPAGALAGSAASSFISSLGTAGVNIAAQIGQGIADAFVASVVPALGSVFASYLPGINLTTLGMGGQGGIFNKAGNTIGNIIGGSLGVFSTFLAAILSIIPLGGANALAGVFDSGGMASGIGFMPKAVLEPERILSPRQTSAFERMVSALESGNFRGSNTSHINAPISVTGDQAGAQLIQDHLLALTTS